MSEPVYLFLVILVLFLMIFVTRAVPFWIGGVFKNNIMIKTIGRFLPAYMMMLLVIFEIQPKAFFTWPYAMPAIISLILLTLTHFWKRQILLSIAIGTISYLIVSYYV